MAGRGVELPAAPGPAIDPATLLDPELLPALQALRPGVYPFDKPPFAAPAFFTCAIPGPPGAPDVRVYVINARAGTARPGIVHMHAGGFVSGTPLMFMRILQSIAGTLDRVIVSVDYRLAPATRFPGSLEDKHAALRWVHGHTHELGVDPARLALMGESAGGGHAAALAIVARDRGEIPVVLQMLIYAMLDDRTGVSRPIPSHMGTYAWTERRNIAGWKCTVEWSSERSADTVRRGTGAHR